MQTTQSPQAGERTQSVRVYSVQTPKGAACKYAYGSTRLIAVVGPMDTIIAATGRLLSWRSGNYSSKADRIATEFRAEWSGKKISTSEAICRAEARSGNSPRGIRGLRVQLRDEIYNRD